MPDNNSVLNFELFNARNDTKFSRVKYLDTSPLPDYVELKDAFDFLSSFRSLKKIKSVLCVCDPEVERKQFFVSFDCLENANFQFNFESYESKVSVVLNLPSSLCLLIVSSI